LAVPNPGREHGLTHRGPGLGSNTGPLEKLCSFNPLLRFVPGPNPFASTMLAREQKLSSSLVGKIPSVASSSCARGEPEHGDDPPLPSPSRRRPLPPFSRRWTLLLTANPTDGGGGSPRGQDVGRGDAQAGGARRAAAAAGEGPTVVAADPLPTATVMHSRSAATMLVMTASAMCSSPSVAILSPVSASSPILFLSTLLLGFCFTCLDVLVLDSCRSSGFI
jgi:hypothetical protein